MTFIEPQRRESTPPHKTKKYSAPLRLWHWLSAIVISGSLITVLINSKIINTLKTSPLIRSELQKAGVSISDMQARKAAHAIIDSVWDIHTYLGYCLAGLLLFRIVLEFFQLADQKFIRKITSAYVQFNTVKKQREAATQELTVKIIYAIFYVLLIVMVLTGLVLAFEDVAIFKRFRHPVKEVHNFGMYLILAFIAVHLAGVFLAERKNSKGIVSDMINGGNE